MATLFRYHHCWAQRGTPCTCPASVCAALFTHASCAALCPARLAVDRHVCKAESTAHSQASGTVNEGGGSTRVHLYIALNCTRKLRERRACCCTRREGNMFAVHRPRDVPQVCALWQHPAVNSSHTALTTLPHPPAGAQALVLPGAVGGCLCSHHVPWVCMQAHVCTCTTQLAGPAGPVFNTQCCFQGHRCWTSHAEGQASPGHPGSCITACMPPTHTPHTYQPPLLRHSPCG